VWFAPQALQGEAFGHPARIALSHDGERVHQFDPFVLSGEAINDALARAGSRRATRCKIRSCRDALAKVSRARGKLLDAPLPMAKMLQQL
jgi:hypothetical protein